MYQSGIVESVHSQVGAYPRGEGFSESGKQDTEMYFKMDHIYYLLLSFFGD